VELILKYGIIRVMDYHVIMGISMWAVLRILPEVGLEPEGPRAN
jgi:predicted cobalt transporter CbtA